MKSKIYNFLLVLLLTFIFACTDDGLVDPPAEEIKSRGDIISSNLLYEYNIDFISSFFNVLAAQADTSIDLNPIYSIKVYKIVYETIDAKGNSTEASGSIYIPIGINNIPILSAHHGTQTNRNRVGSVSPINAPEGILAGTMGYYGVVPDYLGLGESQILHPYLHEKSSATCVIDLLRAAKIFAAQNNIQINGQLFLAGYSEGGFVTMAAHKEIEANYSNEFTVTASAPMSGSYDLNLTAKTIIDKEIYNEPSFLAFLIVSYNEIYGWSRLPEIFQSQYSNIVTGLFYGSKTTDEINGFLTDKVSDLFKPEFVSNYLSGNDMQLNSAFSENSLLNWTPIAPMKLFHGTADEFVPYENSLIAVHGFNMRGSTNIELVSIEGGTHATAAIPSLIGAAAWFNTFKNQNSSPKISEFILSAK
ncbi:MAG: lipase family protein [Bacteroidetes bacterium]|nr:lipase family protein [Bacteroidota bacterium]